MDKEKDFDIPQASVLRILKASLPTSVQVTKEAKIAFAKAAGIFVLYLTSVANEFCRENNRQTVSAGDVFDALKEIDLEDFVEPLKKCLQAQRESTQAKKKAKISDGDTVEAVAPQGDDDAKEEEVANLDAVEKGKGEVGDSRTEDEPVENEKAAGGEVDEHKKENDGSDVVEKNDMEVDEEEKQIGEGTEIDMGGEKEKESKGNAEAEKDEENNAKGGEASDVVEESATVKASEEQADAKGEEGDPVDDESEEKKPAKNK